MDHATTFDYVMRDIWSGVDGDKDGPVIAHAIAAWVKTHKWINPENALDVLDTVWRDSIRSMHFENWAKDDARDPMGCVCHVYFDDDSRALIDCPRGIGSSVELV
jgi:hypothetical protein